MQRCRKDLTSPALTSPCLEDALDVGSNLTRHVAETLAHLEIRDALRHAAVKSQPLDADQIFSPW